MREEKRANECVCFTSRWCKSLVLVIEKKKNPWSCPPFWTLIQSHSAGDLLCSCAFWGESRAAVYLKGLSGWWKDVMKWCDITSVDELTAKLWPDATSLLRLIEWLTVRTCGLLSIAHTDREGHSKAISQGTCVNNFVWKMTDWVHLSFICTKCERTSL